MSSQHSSKLNQLQRRLPARLPVTYAWLQEQGYSRSLVKKYVRSGWLASPARGVFYRTDPELPLRWMDVIRSLQHLLRYELVIGGFTALELAGYSHYVSAGQSTIHVYGPKHPPTWVNRLEIDVVFQYHRQSVPSTLSTEQKVEGTALRAATQELAALQLLEELPKASWHQVDMVFESLTDMRPSLSHEALTLASVKARRLFFWFAERHGHAWVRYLNRERVDLGHGKRQLTPGGHLDPKYLITVPRDMAPRSGEGFHP